MFLTLPLLSACGNDPVVQPENPCTTGHLRPTVLIVATATSTEPQVSLDVERQQFLVKAAAAQDACVAVVTGSGEPIRLPLTPFRADGEPERGSRRPQLVADNVAHVVTTLSRLAATSPGLDLAGTLRRATRLFPDTHEIILISSGLSTVDPFAFQTTGWDFDTPSALRSLGNEGWLPDLTGDTVSIVGLGATAGRQPDLTPPLQKVLTTFWTSACTTAHAAKCLVSGVIASEKPPLATNAVPVVPLPGPKVDGHLVSVPSMLLFSIGSAVLSPEADAVLLSILHSSQARTIVVIGHTDALTGTSEGNRALSEARARAVATALVRLGFPAARITYRGLGSAGFSAASEATEPRLVSLHRCIDLVVTTAATPA